MMTREQFLEIVKPSGMQYLVCSLVSVAVFVLFYLKALGGKLAGGDMTSSLLNQIDYRQQFAAYLDNNITHTAVIILFWSLVGLVAYTAVWLLTNALIRARNEVVIETAYANKGSVGNRVFDHVRRWGLVLAFIAVLILAVVYILPIWLHFFTEFLVMPLGLQGAIWLIAAFLGLSVSLYAIWLFADVVFAAA